MTCVLLLRRMEQTYPAIRAAGLARKKPSLDSYVQLHHVDGYRIELSQEAPGIQLKSCFLLILALFRQ